MPIFNSLGSNYTLSFALQALTQFRSHPDQIQNLSGQLNQLYQGNITYFNQGRQALTALLNSFNLPANTPVLTPALTCQAVEAGILNANLQPVFVDLDHKKLTPSLTQYQKALTNYPTAKVIILQHTLGYPQAAVSIINWARSHQLFIIQDLAHAFGAKDNNQFVGENSDGYILSFGKDKIIDATTGGAAISQTTLSSPTATPPLINRIALRLYPITCRKITLTYNLFLGKLLHWFLRFTPIFTPSTKSSGTQPQLLPPNIISLILRQLNTFPQVLDHRRSLAHFYQTNLHPQFQLELPDVGSSTCLRFPIKVNNRPHLLEILKQHGFHLSDIWYQHPVDSGSQPSTTTYQSGSCPQAEQLSTMLINLPTHIHITLNQAKHLIHLINQYAT